MYADKQIGFVFKTGSKTLVKYRIYLSSSSVFSYFTLKFGDECLDKRTPRSRVVALLLNCPIKHVFIMSVKIPSHAGHGHPGKVERRSVGLGGRNAEIIQLPANDVKSSGIEAKSHRVQL